MIPYTPNPFIYIGNFKIQTEFLFLIIAFCVFFYLSYKGLKKNKLISGNKKDFFLFLFLLIFSSLAGGRIWHYTISMNYGWKSLIYMLDLSRGGLTSFGMIFGAVLFVLVYFLLKKKKKWQIEFARVLDVLAIPTAVWIFIYRIGCFITGDVIGTETNLPWALQFPVGTLHHPLAFYLSLNGLFIAIILKVFFGKEKTNKSKFGKSFDGEVGLWFLLLYSFNRFWLEFLRVGERHLGLNQPQWVCFVVFFICLSVIIHGFIFFNKFDLKTKESYISFKKKNKCLSLLEEIRYVYLK